MPTVARFPVNLILSIVSLWVAFFRFLSKNFFMLLLFGVSCKQWLLTCFVFFSISKSHEFLYILSRKRFNARKCRLCQTLVCTERRSQKQKLLLLWDNKLPRNDRDACIRHKISKPETSRNNRRTSSVYLCWWQWFLTSLHDTSLHFCSPQSFSRKKLPGHVECCFDQFAEIILRQNPNILDQWT